MAPLLNHESQIARFRAAVENDRLGSTYLFVGKPGVGKRTFAIKLAQALLCERPTGNLIACESCPACQQVQSLTHPDLIHISKPADKSIIPVELFIGDKEHRRQVGLIHDIGLKPFRGGRKIAIIDDADFLNQEGANSLLKTLEEPPPNSLLILIGTSEQQQLQTILSRSQIVRFSPLSRQQVLQLLEPSEIETEVPLEQVADAADGSMVWAARLADREMFDFREQLFEQLASGDPGKDEFTKTMTSFVESAGTESPAKRERLVFLADLAVSLFRYAYLLQSGNQGTVSNDECTQKWARQLVAQLAALSHHAIEDTCATLIERTLDLQGQVYANVSVTNAIDAWLIDLGRVCRRMVLADAR